MQYCAITTIKAYISRCGVLNKREKKCARPKSRIRYSYRSNFLPGVQKMTDRLWIGTIGPNRSLFEQRADLNGFRQFGGPQPSPLRARTFAPPDCEQKEKRKLDTTPVTWTWYIYLKGRELLQKVSKSGNFVAIFPCGLPVPRTRRRETVGGWGTRWPRARGPRRSRGIAGPLICNITTYLTVLASNGISSSSPLS